MYAATMLSPHLSVKQYFKQCSPSQTQQKIERAQYKERDLEYSGTKIHWRNKETIYLVVVWGTLEKLLIDKKRQENYVLKLRKKWA